MNIDLAGRLALLCGAEAPLLDAIGAALVMNGCAVSRAAQPGLDPLPDLLIVAQALRLAAGPGAPLPDLGDVGEAMAARGSGRIVVLVSATAAVPARRFPEASVAAGAAVLAVRTLAMRFGPSVLVNAVGCGAIEGPDGALLSGDTSLLSHVPDGGSGTPDDIVQAVLFLCDPMNSYMTGQLLTVDGGWSTGYGRNF